MAGGLRQREIGATGIRVSAMGLGSSPFRDGPAAAWAPLVERAFDMGITYFDTARSYVNGEDVIACVSPRVRENMTIATKTGARGGPYCLQDLQKSLRTLNRRYIDIWMTHMIASEHEYELCTDLGGFCDIAIAARHAGIIRATGASFHAPTDLILRAINERAFDVVMFPFNVIGRETVFGSSIASYRDRLLPAAQANGVGVVVMKVLAGGELKHGAPGLRFLADREAGRDVPGGAIRAIAMRPDIATAVIGMSTLAELEANVAAASGAGDDAAQANRWMQQVETLAQSECTRCGKCLGVCPEGIEIPKVFRLFDQARRFGMHGVARFKYRVMETDASACRECGRCQVVCPESFDIASLLRDAHLHLAHGITPMPSN